MNAENGKISDFPREKYKKIKKSLDFQNEYTVYAVRSVLRPVDNTRNVKKIKFYVGYKYCGNKMAVKQH